MINPHFINFFRGTSNDTNYDKLKNSYKGLQEQFGGNLKKIRESKGLSLRSLSSNCDLDDSQISKIENGKTNIQLSTIFELAKGLEISPKELLDF